jgi:hypothetical protein
MVFHVFLFLINATFCILCALLAVWFVLVSCLPYSWNPKMQVTCSSEIVAIFQWTTNCLDETLEHNRQLHNAIIYVKWK